RRERRAPGPGVGTPPDAAVRGGAPRVRLARRPGRSPAGPDDPRARSRARRDGLSRGRAHRPGGSPHLLGHLAGHGRRSQEGGRGPWSRQRRVPCHGRPGPRVAGLERRCRAFTVRCDARPGAGSSRREARRVLRDGGRLAYAVWGPPDRNPWLTLFVGAFLQTGNAPPGGDPIGPSGVFSLATPDANREILDAAGFTDVRIEEIPRRLPFDDFE